MSTHHRKRTTFSAQSSPLPSVIVEDDHSQSVTSSRGQFRLSLCRTTLTWCKSVRSPVPTSPSTSALHVSSPPLTLMFLQTSISEFLALLGFKSAFLSSSAWHGKFRECLVARSSIRRLSHLHSTFSNPTGVQGEKKFDFEWSGVLFRDQVVPGASLGPHLNAPTAARRTFGVGSSMSGPMIFTTRRRSNCGITSASLTKLAIVVQPFARSSLCTELNCNATKRFNYRTTCSQRLSSWLCSNQVEACLVGTGTPKPLEVLTGPGLPFCTEYVYFCFQHTHTHTHTVTSPVRKKA